MIREHTLGEMAVRMGVAAAGFRARANAALRVCARMIEASAKSEFGHYQPSVGPHPAWAELADATKQQRVALGYSENDPLLRSGELRESISHEVFGLEAAIGSTSEVMLYQELGSKDGSLPARPVLGPAAFVNKERVQAILGAAMIQGVMGLKLGVQSGVAIAQAGYSLGPDD
jgi:phage gpG-like protein